MQDSEEENPKFKTPQISLIVAMTSERVIGTTNGLPWHLSDELQLFKRTTMGHTVIMGRKTHESIGQPLPGRHNIVLSRSVTNIPGVHVSGSFEESLTAATKFKQKIFIIGGAEVYQQALSVATELYISWIKEKFPGEIFFPEIDTKEWLSDWSEDYPEFKHVHYHRK